MKKFVLFLTLLMAMGWCALAQETSKNLQRADKAYQDDNFKKALDNYLKVSTEEGVTAYVARQIGNCYRILGDMVQAEVWYDNATKQPDHTGFDTFLLGYVQKANGKSDIAAETLYKLYAGDDKNKSSISSASASFVSKLRGSFLSFQVTPTILSSQEADFSPSFYKDAIVFTTSRRERELINYKQINPQQHLNLFGSKLSSTGELGKPYIFSDDLLSQYYTGPIAFSPTYDTAYFVRKKYLIIRYGEENEISDNNLKINRAIFSNGKWVDQGPLSFCSDDHSIGDPAVSPDGKRLYYISDIKGGIGGTDIYYREIKKNGTFGEAVNLGPKVNTTGNEMSPFIAKDGTLFFSSDTHLGLGNLDLYVALSTTNGFDNVTNLGFPVNGPYDDFGLQMNSDMTLAFFSSNRPDGPGDDDIYKVTIEKKGVTHTINGQVVDEKGTPVVGSTIKINMGGKLINTLLTDANGKFTFNINDNLEAKLDIETTDFFSTVTTVSSFGLGLKPEQIPVTIKLKKDVGYTLIGTITSTLNGSQLDNVQVIAYPPDTLKAIIGTTDQLGRFNIRLSKDTDYRVKATKVGFVPNWFKISTVGRDRGEINLSTLFETKLTPETKPGVNGTITDSKTSLPLSNSIITLSSTNLPQPIKLATDASGSFSQTNMKEGTYSITIEKDGYKPMTLNIELGKQPLNLNSINKLALEPIESSYTAVGLVTNKEDNAPVQDVIITLVNKTTNEKLQKNTDEFGSFDFRIEPEKIYILKLEKDKFFAKTIMVTTQGMQGNLLNLNNSYDLKMEAIVMNKAIEIPNIYYDLGKSNIKPEAAQELDKVVKLLQDNPTIQIELSSHTDARGDKTTNMLLSQKRADAAVKYIVSKKIDKSRIVAKGYGDTMIKNHCTKGVKCSEEEHAVNRRTEIKVISF